MEALLIILVLVVIAIIVAIVKAPAVEPAPKDTGTTGNDTYDFINDATGVDLFDKE